MLDTGAKTSSQNGVKASGVEYQLDFFDGCPRKGQQADLLYRHLAILDYYYFLQELFFPIRFCGLNLRRREECMPGNSDASNPSQLTYHEQSPICCKTS